MDNGDIVDDGRPPPDGKTPACAGRTATSPPMTAPAWEDPPPTRAGPVLLLPRKCFARKTPACAGRTSTLCRGTAGRSEDPRLRGEDAGFADPPISSFGRPPPARGGRDGGRAEHDHCRKTPACAGRTRRRRPAPPWKWEDPRLRGEDRSGLCRRPWHFGRPPPARGGPVGVDGGALQLRKTPACAGRTSTAQRSASGTAEDPRLRGEDTKDARSRMIDSGRPPPARGGLHPGQPEEEAHRKTPACAGRTPTVTSGGPGSTEDPRLRGEDLQVGVIVGAGLGRPPPARGGGTRPDRPNRPYRAEDPRLRGEDRPNGVSPPPRAGRPPPARGGRRGGRHPLDVARKTSACAGRTSIPTSATTRAREDPPPARGGPGPLTQVLGAPRKTPACAGGPGARQRGRPGRRKTPACAGRTPGRRCASARRPEDPRLRGEDIAEANGGLLKFGRPPPARGGQRGNLGGDPERRKTPACAGRTSSSPGPPTSTTEDPRLRGEDYGYHTVPVAEPGRPPPARGGRDPRRARDLLRRKTPACAGEDAILDATRVVADGRPPPARGGHVQELEQEGKRRKTPACAGRTRSWTCTRCGCREDPRLRGEDIGPIAAKRVADGRPPPARGGQTTSASCRQRFNVRPIRRSKTRPPGCCCSVCRVLGSDAGEGVDAAVA